MEATSSPAPWLDLLMPLFVIGLMEIYLFHRPFRAWRQQVPNRCLCCSPVWYYWLILSCATAIVLLVFAGWALVGKRSVLAGTLIVCAVFFGLRPLLTLRTHRRAGHLDLLHPHPPPIPADAEQDKGEEREGNGGEFLAE